MSIKSYTFPSTPTSSRPYPKLVRVKSHGWIVLMHAENKGVLVANPTNGMTLGSYSDNWTSVNDREDYNGVVTIEND